MRYEFFEGLTSLGSVVWEGPGQVRYELAETPDGDGLARDFTRYLTGDAVYLTGAFDQDDEGLRVRRRDSTPWEFRQACLAFAHARSYTAVARPVGPVEDREVEEAWGAGG